MSEREMTLQEWVERLPETHAARREYDVLRSRLAEAVKDNERLHAVAGRLIAVIRNVHGHLLDDRIDAALLGATDSTAHRENGSHE